VLAGDLPQGFCKVAKVKVEALRGSWQKSSAVLQEDSENPSGVPKQ
jgi:hypothetical protein